jgi:exopolyphosphatase / guanosine-5'-triphosphate,3'-diphosphate pyrophosphatase
MSSDSKLRLDAILDLARRYNYDEVHSHQVECLAGTIFMELAEYHKLDRGDRKLLEYSAILHDIGYFVSPASHHRHALMMILTEPLIPFSRDEVKIIANVARYHRKALPTPEHTVYGTLSEADRQRVNYMAAMLRVADALDKSRKGLVKELTCDVTEDSIVFNITADQEMEAERAAVGRRGDLFISVFRKTPLIEVQLPKLATPQAVFQTA